MHYAIAWTKDGKLLAEADSNIDLMSTEGKTITTLGKLAGQPNGCRDGRVLFVQADLKSTSLSIWISGGDGGGLRQVTFGKNDINPVCSPDVKWAYYFDGDTRKLMKVPVEGGTPQIAAPDLVDAQGGMDFGPDGRTLVLGTYDFKAQRPTFSLLSTDSGQILRTYEYDSRHIGGVRFSPDGKAIVYPVREMGVDNLWLQPLDGSPGHQLTKFDSLKIYSYQWSPDRKGLALLRGDDPSDIVLIQESQSKN
jgi:Tol biopolymer transport system component